MAADNINELLTEMIQSATLMDINLKSITAEANVPASTVIPSETKLTNKKQVTYAISEKKNVLACFVSYTSFGTPKESESEDGKLFEISATYALIYTLPEKEYPSKVYEIFSDKNAFYNAYPYLRELFQTTSVRLGIDPIILPLLKPTTKKELQQATQEK